MTQEIRTGSDPKPILINCKPCMKDKCNDCLNPKSCLCAVETEHNTRGKIIEKESTPESQLNTLIQIYEVDENLDFSGKDKIDHVAKVFLKFYNFVTLKKLDEILLYNGKIYDGLKAESLIKERTEKLIPNCTTHDVKEVINKIKRKTYVDLESFDSDPNLITIENGILNLETLELLDHTPKHLSRVLLPVEYTKPKHKNIEKNLKDTLFWKYLKSSFTINGKLKKEDFETILEIIASPIVKRHIDEKAIMFLGAGENGKSVCLGFIESMLGLDNISSITLQDIAENKFLRANLSGKSANIFSDLEKNELRFSGKIKAIISGEGIEVEKKYQQGLRIKPFAKLMFSCNRFPKSYDQSQGFFRRWMIIKWERNFENDPERIPYLREKLQGNKEERNLIFSCLVGIANQLNKTGKFTHTKDWKIVQKEWNENADPLDDFATNYIIDSEGDKSKISTYQWYKEVCYLKGEAPLGMGQFTKGFREYYEEDRDSSGKQRVWLNIDFKKPKQKTFEATS